MSLGEHLTELRDRILWCAVTVVLMTIAGWFVFDWVFAYLQAPFEAAVDEGLNATINYGGIGNPLGTRLQMSAYIGLVLSSPMILFQVWRFVTPGLHRNERRYVIGFFGSAIPLFLIGCVAGYWMINRAVPLLLEFTPNSKYVSNVIDYPGYLNLLSRGVLAFGIAFVAPVFLVLFNAMGILPGRAMLKAWRWVTLVCFVFTAVMVPTPDPFTMIGMTIPMVALYFAAVGISIRHDKRRERALDVDIDDESASVIDDEVEAIDAPESIDEADRR